MLRRITILLFVFAVTAQAFAGVCVCLTERDEHLCCLPAISGQMAVSQPPCCEASCAQPAAKNPQNSNPETNARKLAPPAVGEMPLSSPNFALAADYRAPSIGRLVFSDRLRLARPPRLYLRHHSLLI